MENMPKYYQGGTKPSSAHASDLGLKASIHLTELLTKPKKPIHSVL